MPWKHSRRNFLACHNLGISLKLSTHHSMEKMESLVSKRMQDLEEAITEICAFSGTPGLSYGVLHENEVLQTRNFGYADVQARIPTTSNTRYCIGSLTKAFTAAAVGTLVEAGKFSWESSVYELLGVDFHFSDPNLTQRMSVIDLLSHRMGLQRSNQLWYGNDNVLLLDKEKVIPHVQYLKSVQPYNSTVHYSRDTHWQGILWKRHQGRAGAHM